MQSNKMIYLSVLYVVIIMIIVSLDGTYTITHTLFGRFIGKPSQEKYGTGLRLTSPGFIIHLIIFTALLLMPMLLSNQ